MQKDNFYSKISKRSFSKIYKNYSKGKISRVLPANIILSPFPYDFHPCNEEIQERVTCAFHSRTWPKGIKRERKGERREEEEREKGRERGGRGEREREKELLLAEVSVDCWPVGGSTRRSNRLQGATSDR